MRILITGGCGFIGSHLVDKLRPGPFELQIVDNLKRAVEGRRAGPPVRVHEIDIRDRDALREAMRGVDVVYHLATQSNVLGAVQDMDYAFTSNVVGTYNVLTCARECGVQRLIFTSSREVYGEVAALPVTESAAVSPKNVYGATKAAGELLCRSFAGESLRVSVLRLANVYGTRDSGRVIPLFIEKATGDQPLTIFGEDKVLDFVWVGDVVDALVGLLSTDIEGPLNIGSGQGTTLPELAGQILRLTGSSSVIQQAPARGMEVDRFVADIGRARKLLNFHPSPPLRYLQEVIDDLIESSLCGAGAEQRGGRRLHPSVQSDAKF